MPPSGSVQYNLGILLPAGGLSALAMHAKISESRMRELEDVAKNCDLANPSVSGADHEPRVRANPRNIPTQVNFTYEFGSVVKHAASCDAAHPGSCAVEGRG